ncbi:MAG: hypothetical protein JRN32_01800 [Nitrososphaerota archaeon]|jgi:hypothetical protein|nr:hypothetical protein [Nitrososphaerota archaeon]
MAKLGWNKGQLYEQQILRILWRKGLLMAPSPGTPGGVDSGFRHLGKPYKLEVKLGLSADYGQKKLIWSKEDGWAWAKPDSITDFYDGIGALKYVVGRGVIPLKYSKYSAEDKHKITQQDADADRDAFENNDFVTEPEAVWRFYGRKDIHYIQIGSGYGFYHLDSDPAGLGTERFECSFYLRLRAKPYHKKHRTKDAEGRVVRTVKTPWDYDFYAVLRVRTRPKKSPYNVEKAKGQKFPPIQP